MQPGQALYELYAAADRFEHIVDSPFLPNSPPPAYRRQVTLTDLDRITMFAGLLRRQAKKHGVSVTAVAASPELMATVGHAMPDRVFLRNAVRYATTGKPPTEAELAAMDTAPMAGDLLAEAAAITNDEA